MPSATRPKLGKLSTPVSSTFPSEITSANTATPLSAVSMYIKQEPADYIKTPISPPVAYTDFLTRAMFINSPSTVSTPTTATTSAPISASAAALAAASGEVTPDSVPSTANSEKSQASSKAAVEGPSPGSSTTSVDSIPETTTKNKRSPPATAACVPPSPYSASATAAARGPLSAPPTGLATFPSLRLPPSPAISHLDSPHSARSPFSARSMNSSSVFDWDAALKARFAEQRKQKSSRTSVRHIREVVTRTVTYTPKMEPAPKGKRRKLE